MKLDELPELPFLKVLDYLSLQDLFRLRSVSRSCYEKVVIRVTSLCFSDRRYIYGRSRWLSGAFAQNFISSNQFVTFFDTFSQTILSNLRHLRLCDLDVRERDRATFIRTLNLFGQLEQLDMIHVLCRPPRGAELNLPMLTGIHLENLYACRKFTLNTPRLRNVEFRSNYYGNGYGHLRVEIVHGESVERLITDSSEYLEVMTLKNLKYLSAGYFLRTDSTLLSSLKQLKEIRTDSKWAVSELFEQKQQYGRDDLKVYFKGLLLYGPDDPAFINAN